MSFTSKNLTHSSRSGMSFLKGATFFFLGMSLVMFMTKALQIEPIATKNSFLIKDIVLTQDGTTATATGVVINGSGGLVEADTLSGKKVCINGNCQTNRPAGGGTSVWSTGSSNVVYYNLGDVGIGTSSPTEKLHIDGNIKTNGFWSKGGSTQAIGSSSTAIGTNTIANGEHSIAIGNDSQTHAYSSIAMGQTAQTYGEFSIALGTNTIASGESSTAMGNTTIARGDNSTAMGSATEAIGNSSTAMGFGTKAVLGASTVLGTYNEGISNAIFEVGIGVQGATKNALTILNNHPANYGFVGIGTSSPQYKLSLGNAGDIFGYSKTYTISPVTDTEFGTITLFSGNKMTFSLKKHSMAAGETSFIFSGGNVGIGTNTPTEKLEVNGNISLSEGLNRTIKVNDRNTEGKGYDLSIYGGKANSMMINYTGGYINLQGGMPGGVFAPGGHDSRYGKIIMNASGGYVGIGTGSPTAKLHVDGTFRIKSYIFSTMPICDNSGEITIYTNSTGTNLCVCTQGGRKCMLFDNLADPS